MDQVSIENIVQKVLGQIKGQEGLGLQAPQAETVSPATPADAAGREIPVELSGRHVHLCQADIDQLFKGKLTHAKELSQPGQYLCKERVRLVGPKGVIDNVAVLGPARPASQVELSLTDARILGIKAPVRQSGDVQGTPGVVMTSPNGLVGLEQGVMVAARHIHMAPADAARFGLKDKQKVAVMLTGERPATFHEVIVRVHKDFKPAMHIDFDEANSCGLGPGATGRILNLA